MALALGEGSDPRGDAVVLEGGQCGPGGCWGPRGMPSSCRNAESWGRWLWSEEGMLSPGGDGSGLGGMR